MAVSKVVYAGTTLVDLTGDTVTPQTLALGVTAHNLAGEKIVGTMTSGGTGSGGGNIVYTNEPPNENSDKSKIYIVTQPSAELWLVDDGAAGCYRQTVNVASGGLVHLKVYLVDSLPDNMEAIDENTFTVPVYIDSSGIAYVKDVGGGVYRFSEIYGKPLPDKGFVDNYGQINWSESGIYCIRKEFLCIYVAKGGVFYQFEFPQPPVKYMIDSTGDYYNAYIDVLAAARHAEVLGEYNGLPVKLLPSMFFGDFFKTVSIGDGIERIEANTFDSYVLMDNIRLPETLKYIGEYAFAFCYSLAEMVIPRSVEEIGDLAFISDYNLAVVKFEGTPRAIGRFAFDQCYGLYGIYVPWSKSDPINANAPWGAPDNVTIHYNYTGE